MFKSKHISEFLRALRNFHYDYNSEGQLVLEKQGVGFSGEFTHGVRRGNQIVDEISERNLIPSAALAYLLNVHRGSAPETSWYIALFKTSGYSPAASNTNANIVSLAGECDGNDYTTGGSTTVRPAWTTVAAGTTPPIKLTNEASRASFVITAEPSLVVYGAFISSANLRGDTSGAEILLATKKFASARTLETTDDFLVKYELTASSS